MYRTPQRKVLSMSLTIDFVWPNTLWDTRLNKRIESAARQSLKKFFRHCKTPPRDITLRVRGVPKAYGVLKQGRHLVVVSDTEPSTILISIEGAQGIKCDVSSDIIALVECGPYLKIVE